MLTRPTIAAFYATELPRSKNLSSRLAIFHVSKAPNPIGIHHLERGLHQCETLGRLLCLQRADARAQGSVFAAYLGKHRPEAMRYNVICITCFVFVPPKDSEVPTYGLMPPGHVGRGKKKEHSLFSPVEFMTIPASGWQPPRPSRLGREYCVQQYSSIPRSLQSKYRCAAQRSLEYLGNKPPRRISATPVLHPPGNFDFNIYHLTFLRFSRNSLLEDTYRETSSDTFLLPWSNSRTRVEVAQKS